MGLGKPGPKTEIGLRSNPISLKEVLGENHKNIADRARKLAAVPDRKFERVIGGWRSRVTAETERVTINLVRKGARDQTRAARALTGPVAAGYRVTGPAFSRGRAS